MDVYPTSASWFLRRVYRVWPLREQPLDICSKWRNRWHSSPYNCKVIYNPLKAATKWRSTYYQWQPNAMVYSMKYGIYLPLDWYISEKISYDSYNVINKIPRPYRFDPIDENARNVITPLFVCSPMQRPNAMDCVHCGRDVTMHRD